MQGNELYIYSGPAGKGGVGGGGPVTATIANGHVTVPSVVWKVIVVLQTGDNDAERVAPDTRAIAVIMSNAETIGKSTPSMLLINSSSFKCTAPCITVLGVLNKEYCKVCDNCRGGINH